MITPIAPNSMIRGRYLIVQMIGQGAQSDVYLAVDQRDGIAVALKRSNSGALDPSATGALEREAVALTRLGHPVLPKVKDHFSEGGHYFLVVEHISGENLADRLEIARKPFPLSWVMFWADQLLDALNYLHSHVPPILHGDVNPRNLKLTADNHIVLLDCGLSTGLNRSVDINAAMAGEQTAGARHFPSPEQLRGAKTEAAGDLYSLSATLYQLVTNTIPPDPMERVDGISSKGADPLMSPSSVNKEVSAAVADVIVKGLALRPNERFNTAVEMQHELRKAFNLVSMPKGDETAVMPRGAAGSIGAETVAITPVSPSTGLLDATINMGAGAPLEPPRQSDVRTEIFQVHETSPNKPAAPPPSSQREAALPTVPFTPAAAPDPYPSQVTQIAAVKQKKSSKAGLVVGVAIGLLLLAIVAVGGGVFVYKTYFVEPIAEATPTPAPTPLSTPAEVITSREPVGTQEEPTPEVIQPPTEREETETPTAATPGTERNIPPPRVTVRNTPASKPPPVKSTPKPPPVRDDRTVILQ